MHAGGQGEPAGVNASALKTSASAERANERARVYIIIIHGEPVARCFVCARARSMIV